MSDRTVYTFQDLVDTVKSKIGLMSSRLTNFSAGSNLLSIIESFCHFVEYLQLRTNKAIDAFAIKNAEDTDLDLRAGDYNIARKQTKSSTGIVTFSRTTPAPSQFAVYAGSEVSTTTDVYGNSLSYTLDADITFPSGAMSVTGNVTCTVDGIIGNIVIGQISRMTSVISGVDSVTNLAAFTDGANKETDEALRKRIPIVLNGLKAAVDQAIKAAVLSVQGITVVRVSDCEPAPGQITVYVSNESGTLSAQQLTDVKTAILSEIAFGVTYNVLTPDVVYVQISMDVTYDDEFYTKEEIDNNLRDSLFTFVTTNPETNLKLWDLQVLIRDIPGVTNLKNLKIAGVADDYTTSGFKVIRLVDKQNPVTITYTADT